MVLVTGLILVPLPELSRLDSYRPGLNSNPLSAIVQRFGAGEVGHEVEVKSRIGNAYRSYFGGL
jgi:hypothetical protein